MRDSQTPPEGAAAAPTRDDFNNSIERNGQDWFVNAQDADREEEDGNLCVPYIGTDGYQCQIIRCTARRKLLTEDEDDMPFKPTAAAMSDMTIKGKYSYIKFN